MVETTSMPVCPMAATCQRMRDKPGSGLWMMIPGILLIALGVLIFLYPQMLIWLVAIMLVAMGIVLLLMTGIVRKMGQRPQKPTD